MARIEAIILSMTPRGTGKSGSFESFAENSRIAKGAGVDIGEVNQLVKQFEQTQKDDEAAFLE